MASSLYNQLKSYETESWKFHHQRAMECFDLENWLDYGLSILEAIKRSGQRYQNYINSGKGTLNKKMVESLDELFKFWYSPCAHLLGEIKAFEDEGYVIANADAFREACAECHVPEFTPQALFAAEKQINQTGGHLLAGVLNELCDPAFGSGI